MRKPYRNPRVRSGGTLTRTPPLPPSLDTPLPEIAAIAQPEPIRLEAPPWWTLSRVEKRAALIAILLAVVARLHAFLPAYSIDDYSLLNEEPKQLVPATLAQGRALVPLLRSALSGIDAIPPHAAVLISALLTLVLVCFALTASRLWGLQNKAAACTIVLLLATLHPYQAEIFTFRTGSYAVAVAVGLACYALAACFRSSRHWWFSVTALTAALMLYQTVLNYIGIVLLFSLVFRLALPKLDYEFSSRSFFRSQVGLVLVSVCFYALVTALIIKVSGVTINDRGTLIGAGDIPARLKACGNLIRAIFYLPEPIFPAATKLILWAGPVLAYLAYMLSAPRRAAAAIVSRQALAFAIAIFGGVLLTLGFVVVLSQWWPVPRIFGHAGFFWAGIFGLALCSAETTPRRLLLACAAIAIVSFIGINNHVFQDQVRLNVRDFARANRIVFRLESLPEFSKLRGVVLVGPDYGYRSALQTSQGDMNISALGAPWSKLPLLNELSGYRFQSVPGPIAQKANAYCAASEAWPAEPSVTAIESYAVVCIAK